MARQTIVSTQQAERITDRALRHIRPIFGKCYGYPVSGNHRRPRRYDRRLLRVFYLSAQLSIRSNVDSKAYYDRKRGEGKRHTQAVLALARRRANVLWAMLRDNAVYQPGEPGPIIAAVA